jgi:hypothetical protein
MASNAGRPTWCERLEERTRRAQRRSRRWNLSAVLALLTAACAAPPSVAPAPPPAPAPPKSEPVSPESPPQPSLEGLALEPAPIAAPSKKTPTLAFVSPTLDQELPVTSAPPAAAPAAAGAPPAGSAATSKASAPVLAGDFEIKLSVKDWDPNADGLHIHFTLDEGKNGQTTVWPAGTRTKFDVPLAMSTLSRNKPLAAGEHVLATYACRKGHESIKGEGSLAVVRFWVGPKLATQAWTPTSPMLVFFHPEVEFDGAGGARALIDWQLANVTLGEGQYRLDLSINEGPAPRDERRTFAIGEWRPFLIEGLKKEAGAYAMTLQLVDSAGKPVLGPWSSASQAIDMQAPPDVAQDADPARK